MNDVTLITGASQGIGAATARLLAAQGHTLLIHCAHRADLAQAVADECLQLGSPRAIVAQADLATESDVLQLFATADAALPPLTGLVNNAGIIDRTSRLDEMSAERLARMFAVNVVGPMLCAREAVKRMSTKNGGKGAIACSGTNSRTLAARPQFNSS